MSSTFALDLSTAQVGAAVNESFVNLTGGNTQFAVQNGEPPFLVLHNESRFGLTITIQGGGLTFKLPAGGWTEPFPLPMTATGLSATPFYALPTGNVNQLAGTIYAPGDPVVHISTLGNSPIGGSLTTPSSPANSFEQDLFTSWVLTGLVCTKDLSISNQLDVTAGIAFLVQADSSLGRLATNATTFLTSIPSTSYFLDLNPDGSFSFATTHSVVSNHLTICSLTTDGSGNILVVTDARTLNSTMLSAMSGALAVPPLLVKRGGLGVIGTLVAGDVLDVDSLGSTYVKAASGRSITFQVPSGNTVAVMGSNGGFSTLAGQNTAGTFGVPVIVAQTLWQAVTTTGLQAVLTTGTLPEGLYRINAYINYSQAPAVALVIRAEWSSKSGSGVGGIMTSFLSVNGAGNSPLQLNGTNTFSGPVEFPLMPIDIYIKASTAITVKYNDPSGTPADNVTVVIERLA